MKGIKSRPVNIRHQFVTALSCVRRTQDISPKEMSFEYYKVTMESSRLVASQKVVLRDSVLTRAERSKNDLKRCAQDLDAKPAALSDTVRSSMSWDEESSYRHRCSYSLGFKLTKEEREERVKKYIEDEDIGNHSSKENNKRSKDKQGEIDPGSDTQGNGMQRKKSKKSASGSSSRSSSSSSDSTSTSSSKKRGSGAETLASNSPSAPGSFSRPSSSSSDQDTGKKRSKKTNKRRSKDKKAEIDSDSDPVRNAMPRKKPKKPASGSSPRSSSSSSDSTSTTSSKKCGSAMSWSAMSCSSDAMVTEDEDGGAKMDTLTTQRQQTPRHSPVRSSTATKPAHSPVADPAKQVRTKPPQQTATRMKEGRHSSTSSTYPSSRPHRCRSGSSAHRVQHSSDQHRNRCHRSAMRFPLRDRYMGRKCSDGCRSHRNARQCKRRRITPYHHHCIHQREGYGSASTRRPNLEYRDKYRRPEHQVNDSTSSSTGFPRITCYTVNGELNYFTLMVKHPSKVTTGNRTSTSARGISGKGAKQDGRQRRDRSHDRVVMH